MIQHAAECKGQEVPGHILFCIAEIIVCLPCYKGFCTEFSKEHIERGVTNASTGRTRKTKKMISELIPGVILELTQYGSHPISGTGSSAVRKHKINRVGF